MFKSIHLLLLLLLASNIFILSTYCGESGERSGEDGDEYQLYEDEMTEDEDPVVSRLLKHCFNKTIDTEDMHWLDEVKTDKQYTGMSFNFGNLPAFTRRIALKIVKTYPNAICLHSSTII